MANVQYICRYIDTPHYAIYTLLIDQILIEHKPDKVLHDGCELVHGEIWSQDLLLDVRLYIRNVTKTRRQIDDPTNL